MNSKLRFTFSHIAPALGRGGNVHHGDHLLAAGVTPAHTSKAGITTYSLSFSIHPRLMEQTAWKLGDRLDLELDLPDGSGCLFKVDASANGRAIYTHQKKDRKQARPIVRFTLPLEYDPWRRKMISLACSNIETETGRVAFCLPAWR